jgi:RimJ/RimL family protein N-acetyltransferase
MTTVAEFSTIEVLPSGQRVEIRALTPADREDMLAAVGRTSTQSIYRRFFNVRRHFSEAEISFFLNPDSVRHVALVAVADGRYVVINPGQAEVAFAVVDQFQGQGIATALLRHLSSIARKAGLQEFVAEVLPENTAMLKVFEKIGLEATLPGANLRRYISYLSCRDLYSAYRLCCILRVPPPDSCGGAMLLTPSRLSCCPSSRRRVDASAGASIGKTVTT